MKKLFFGLIVVSLFLFSCATVSEEKACSTDADCVPASCCHPDDAVNKEHAPDCQGLLCTTECVPDTLDCGQGKAKCVSDSCEAVYE